MKTKFCLLGFYFLWMIACQGQQTAHPSLYYLDGSAAKKLEIENALKKGPAPGEEHIQFINLGKSKNLSSHLVWIKTREEPHYHAHHEGTVLLLQGKGTLNLNGEKIPLQVGDVMSIPQGVTHFFVNEGEKPVAAYVIFAPPMEEMDYIPVTNSY